MKIISLLQVLLIFITLLMIRSKNNLKTVIYFSVFSLVSAGLYYFFSAPDLALAEAAIGSAIIPLIFIIAISKQKEFLVVSHIKDDDDFLQNNLDYTGKGYNLLNKFTEYYKLKLVINKGDYDELKGIFRARNVDLVVEKSKKNGKYLLKGKKSSILMNKLEQMTEDKNYIEVIRVEDGEMDD